MSDITMHSPTLQNKKIAPISVKKLKKLKKVNPFSKEKQSNKYKKQIADSKEKNPW